MEIIENFSRNLISFIVYPPSVGWLLAIKIFFISISLLFLGVIVFGLLKTSWFKVRFWDDLVEILTYKPAGIKKIEKDWKKIAERIESGSESECKLAIIEANNMMDEVLEKMGYRGNTLAEKLEKISPTVIPEVEKVKEANKIRNNIVYDPNYFLPLEKTKEIMEIYEEAFRELNVF